MNISLSFIRIIFVVLSTLAAIALAASFSPEGLTLSGAIIGAICGASFGLAIIGADLLLKQFSLKTFNVTIFGLFCGYLMGQVIMLIFDSIFDSVPQAFSPAALTAIRLGIFLFCAYLGMAMTARASDEIYASIPFIKFKPTSLKKKDLYIDYSALMDARILDFAGSGLLDQQLVLPRFLINEITAQQESPDEAMKLRARRGLDTIKKLENIPTLDLRISEHDYPELHDSMSKLIRLARIQDGNILTADLSKIQQAQVEGVRIINLHMLANALKPITQSGETLYIKIQRYGKEPRQGVGYLDDGTMVVVNGGAEFIGETIKAQVLSVKHTSSGRMIFCNALEESFGLSNETSGTASIGL